MNYTNEIKDILRLYLLNDSRVNRAWLFGSVSRGEQHSGSDIDVMIEMKNDKPYTLFDFFEIQNNLEKITNKKIDLVERKYIKPFAWETAKKDLVSIV